MKIINKLFNMLNARLSSPQTHFETSYFLKLLLKSHWFEKNSVNPKYNRL